MSVAPPLELRDLTVRWGEAAPTPDRLSLRIDAGRVVALLGASGSGKSTTLRACLGALSPRAQVAGAVRIDGVDHTRATEATWRALRGARVGLLPQEAAQAFDPRLPIGACFDDLLRLRGGLTDGRRDAAAAALARVGLPPEHLDRLPGRLSGGQVQRAALALALALRPGVLLVDEPTSALDPLTRRRILDLLRSAADDGTATLLVTHDRDGAAYISDEVVELTPREPSPAPARRRAPLAAPILSVREVEVTLPGLAEPVVRGATFDLHPGRVTALVGESGSGKSTLARALARLTPIRTGLVELGGRDLGALDARALRAARRELQLVLQDATDALDPRHTVVRTLQLAADAHGVALDPAALLAEVGLDPALLPRGVTTLSGGQRQRLLVARALVPSPRALLCDEPTSALDDEARDRLLDQLRSVVERRGAALLLITHDLDAARRIADEGLVLRAGVIVERGQGALDAPVHPAARELVDAARLPARRPQ